MTDSTFRSPVAKRIIAFALYLIRLFYFDLNGPHFLSSIESMNWIFAVLGYAQKYLNNPSKLLDYLSQSVYPVYIIHMIFLFYASYIILPLNLSLEINFVLIVFSMAEFKQNKSNNHIIKQYCRINVSVGQIPPIFL